MWHGLTDAISHSVNVDGVVVIIIGSGDTSTAHILMEVVWTCCTQMWLGHNLNIFCTISCQLTSWARTRQTSHLVQLSLPFPRVILKRNSWLVVSAENVKIQYFFKKICSSYANVSVYNDTMKIQKEIEYTNSHILENIVK